MRTAKFIVGIICLAIAIYLTPFCFGMFFYSGLLFKFLTLVFWCGLIAVGVFLIRRRKLPISKGARSLILLFLGVSIASPVILDIYVRHERQMLQARAKEFLSRPVPLILQTNEIDGYQARENETVLSGSRTLIQRYATKGRIRYSAAIAGQFAVQPFETASCEDADIVKTNEEARLYVVECKAIIEKEWQMEFWQWIEDTIELKLTVPEIEEENVVDRFIEKLDGTWTNDFGTMTISPNGTFSGKWTNQKSTNIINGTQMFRVNDETLQVMLADNQEKDFRIIHLDDHNLNYETDGQTNSMNR